jgi:hypothetical protein
VLVPQEQERVLVPQDLCVATPVLRTTACAGTPRLVCVNVQIVQRQAG